VTVEETVEMFSSSEATLRLIAVFTQADEIDSILQPLAHDLSPGDLQT